MNFRTEVCAKARGRLENVFSGRLLYFVQKKTLAIFYTRMPRDAVRQCGKEVEDARESHLEKASSSVPKVKEQTYVKSSNSPQASPATKAENPLSIKGKMKKYRRVIIGIIPCVVVTSLETDAFVAFVAYIDLLIHPRRASTIRFNSKTPVDEHEGENRVANSVQRVQ